MINKYHRTLYILEFKRSPDRIKAFLRVKEDEANEQHRSIIEALRAAAPEWTFEQINFVAGRRGAVVEDNFYNKLDKLNVHAGKRDKILLAHVQRICEAHDTVKKREQSRQESTTNGKIASSVENSSTPMTANSARGVAHTSARPFFWDIRPGPVFGPKTLFVLVALCYASIPSPYL